MSSEEWRTVVQSIARIMNAFALSPALELQLQARNLVDANDLEDIGVGRDLHAVNCSG